jgi:hypothetical protein
LNSKFKTQSAQCESGCDHTNTTNDNNNDSINHQSQSSLHHQSSSIMSQILKLHNHDEVPAGWQTKRELVTHGSTTIRESAARIQNKNIITCR